MSGSRAPKPAFDHCAQAYAQNRPGYPPALLDYLAAQCPPAASMRVLDVGAGTGLFTRELARRGYAVIALEPSGPMVGHVRAGLSERAGRLDALCAAAEGVPLSAQSVNMIACAQAFHWFNPPAALAEFARVLVPSGLLCLVWNNRDAEVSPFVEEFERLVKRYNPAYDREYRQQDWAAKIASSALFEPAQYKRLAWTWSLTHEGFVGFTRSVSYIRNVVARERIGSFESELRRLMAEHYPGGTCDIPMRVDCWTARRLAM